jgi:hypothetical protein
MIIVQIDYRDLENGCVAQSASYHTARTTEKLFHNKKSGNSFMKASHSPTGNTRFSVDTTVEPTSPSQSSEEL